MRSAPLLHSVWRTLLRPFDAKLGRATGWRLHLIKCSQLIKRSYRVLHVVVTVHRQSCSSEI